MLRRNHSAGEKVRDVGVNKSGVPLVFVWVGDDFPDYGQSSIKIAMRNYYGPVVLVSQDNPGIPGIHWYRVDQFKSPLMEAVDQNLGLGRDHRNGIWYVSYERLLIFSVFCEREGLEKAFLAELDLLVLDLSGFADELDSFGDGIFLAPVSRDQVVASLIYQNSRNELDELARYLATNCAGKNEMRVLADFLWNPSTKTFCFASEISLVDPAPYPLPKPSLPPSTGVVDAALIGLWFFGPSKDSKRGIVWNKAGGGRVPSWPPHSLAIRRTWLRRRNYEVQAGELKKWYPLRALHLSAKSHRRFEHGFTAAISLVVSQLPVRVPSHMSAYPIKRRLLIVSTRVSLGLIRLHLTEPAKFLAGLSLSYGATQKIRIPERYRLSLERILSTDVA